MKVVLIYRRKTEGAYSIEEIFHAIAGELHKHVEIVEYETGTRWQTLRDVWRLRKMRADIYHVTGDIHYYVPLLPYRKTVLTIHDINHYLFDLKKLKRIIYKWLWLLWPIRTARAVTAISRETQDNIVKHLGVLRSRIETIEDCYSAIFKPISRPFNIACPVILQVGTKPHKNVPRLIEALRGITCKLVLIGQIDIALNNKLIECGVDYVNCVNLTNEDIYRQYIGCDIVSFISLAEGFGVPIIEAQASGRPLITANISPMREVAGGGACLVDPLNVAQMRDGILRIITDSMYRDQLVDTGLRNVARHSPATISLQYLELYSALSVHE